MTTRELSLHPCMGTGRQWTVTLHVGSDVGLELSADVGERTLDGRHERRGERWQRDELDDALFLARQAAKALGLNTETKHDHSHWTWTP